ncbi:hypothetical protein MD484_g6194, partial [Candolleomyces efflorescens]
MLRYSNLQAIAGVLKRFKKAPARLQLTVAYHSDNLVLDTLLIPFSTSLTSLVLSRVPISHIQALPHGLFPSLEKLVIAVNHEEFARSPWLLTRAIVAFEDAPVLRRLAINDLRIIGILPNRTDTSRFPWHQLTDFIVTDFDTSSDPFLTQILPRCLALRSFHIFLREESCGEFYRDTWANKPVRSMQNLQCLSLNSWAIEMEMGAFQYPNFLDKFKFPGLKSLRLEGSEMDFSNEGACSPGEVDRFIHKLENEFQLEYLSLCHSPVPRETLERLFKATANVVTLDAHIYSNYENLFEALTIGQDSEQRLLPRLKTLTLELSNLEAWDDERRTIHINTFAVFLESRMRHCAPEDRLRKIVLYGPDADGVPSEVPFVREIQPYLAEGLILEKHLVEALREGKADDGWMERAPELQDWLEANAVCKLVSVGII